MTITMLLANTLTAARLAVARRAAPGRVDAV
jgi:hypothetical protein